MYNQALFRAGELTSSRFERRVIVDLLDGQKSDGTPVGMCSVPLNINIMSGRVKRGSARLLYRFLESAS